ncbi:Uu.00g081290.m01.CDS01 [Anthostomella pinea]|uniref:Uu.00g081290.m01.CDS01 n=1 Tax=Anthostomella pinea TaxID=933095 RepID=A0AAI8VL85_9PEZI|nr:Uu.00g081290.m01.CDS01 [Anthostomella pinea]
MNELIKLPSFMVFRVQQARATGSRRRLGSVPALAAFDGAATGEANNRFRSSAQHPKARARAYSRGQCYRL